MNQINWGISVFVYCSALQEASRGIQVAPRRPKEGRDSSMTARGRLEMARKQARSSPRHRSGRGWLSNIVEVLRRVPPIRASWVHTHSLSSLLMHKVGSWGFLVPPFRGFLGASWETFGLHRRLLLGSFWILGATERCLEASWGRPARVWSSFWNLWDRLWERLGLS